MGKSSSYWTIDGMLDATGKKGKKDKDKDSKKKKHDKEGKGKKDKKKKKHEDQFFQIRNQNVYEEKRKKSFKSEEEISEEAVSYSEFLKNSEDGLYEATSNLCGKEVVCYIIKSDEFEFPRVALSKDGDTYKDWLRKKIENLETDINVNKVLYGSLVSKIEIPEGFLKKLIKVTNND